MDGYVIVMVLIFISGGIGWGLFLYSLAQSVSIGNQEMDLVREISHELERIKEDLETLKKTS